LYATTYQDNYKFVVDPNLKCPIPTKQDYELKTSQYEKLLTIQLKELTNLPSKKWQLITAQ